MKRFKNKSGKLHILAVALVLLVASLVPVLSGCSGEIDIDTSDMYLVVYDGNGGYLGNKTATVRKLFCEPGSKIPDYPVDYTKNQYTVPSLGLAMREGYNLVGWYASEDAEYRPSETGEYVYLSTDDGNGIFEMDPSGEYVRKYELNEKGDFIFVHVEESTSEEDSYIYIDANPVRNTADAAEPDGEPVADGVEDTDGESLTDGEQADEPETDAAEAQPEDAEEPVAEDEGEELEPEDVIILSVESGFYVCNGEETIGEISDENLREAYRAAYDRKTYTKAEVNAVAGWQNYEDLSGEYTALFGGLDRYSYSFALADEGDEGLDRYSIASGYASLYSIFIEDDRGDYVYSSPIYIEYDPAEEEYSSAQRYSINDRYVFTARGAKTNPSHLDRYDATMDYWDFSEDKVTEGVCEWNGESYVLTLNAHWVKKNTVYYHYENTVGQVDESWTRLLSDNITSTPIKGGEIIGRKEIIPQEAGHTFVCWSKTKGEYDPWDFENDTFPEGENELHLYAYYIEGTYTRIVSASGLSKVGNDPAGKYLLVSDIDLGGKELTSSPLGLTAENPFTGEFIAFDKTISGVNFKLAPNKRQINDASIETAGALFPATSGATIKGVTVEATATFSGITGSSGGAKRNINFLCSALIGRATGDTTTVENCHVTLDCSKKNETALDSDAFTYVIKLGGICADHAWNKLKTVDCTADVTHDLEGSVRITESRLAVN